MNNNFLMTYLTIYLNFIQTLNVNSLGILELHVNLFYIQIQIKDVTKFPVTFWLITVICVAFYVTIFPFISVAQVFFQKKFGFSQNEAAFLQGNFMNLIVLVNTQNTNNLV